MLGKPESQMQGWTLVLHHTQKSIQTESEEKIKSKSILILGMAMIFGFDNKSKGNKSKNREKRDYTNKKFLHSNGNQ